MLNMSCVRPPTLSVTQISTSISQSSQSSTCTLAWLVTSPVTLLFQLISVWKIIIDLKNLYWEWLLYCMLLSGDIYFHNWVMVLMSGMLFTQSEGGILVMINAIRQDLQSCIFCLRVAEVKCMMRDTLLPVCLSFSLHYFVCSLQLKTTYLSIMYSNSQPFS